MINNEFDDYFNLLGNDYDDNIVPRPLEHQTCSVRINQEGTMRKN